MLHQSLCRFQRSGDQLGRKPGMQNVGPWLIGSRNDGYFSITQKTWVGTILTLKFSNWVVCCETRLHRIARNVTTELVWHNSIWQITESVWKAIVSKNEGGSKVVPLSSMDASQLLRGIPWICREAFSWVQRLPYSSPGWEKMRDDIFKNSPFHRNLIHCFQILWIRFLPCKQFGGRFL